MTDLARYASTRSKIGAALERARYAPPHAALAQLPAPYYLIAGDATLPALALTSGTLVVLGDLTVTGPVDLQQTGGPLANVIVVGACTLGLAYVDGFLVVRDDLDAATLIADSNFKGGVFVGGDLTAGTLVINDMGVEVDGAQHVDRLASTDDLATVARAVPSLFVDDTPEPRHLFLALRDAPAPKGKAAAKKPAAKTPAAKTPAAKTPAAKKPAAKKPAAKKPVAKRPAAKRPAAKRPAARRPAARR